MLSGMLEGCHICKEVVKGVNRLSGMSEVYHKVIRCIRRLSGVSEKVVTTTKIVVVIITITFFPKNKFMTFYLILSLYKD